jgi:hypothetical protein
MNKCPRDGRIDAGPLLNSPPDTRLNPRYDCNMDDFPITPPIIVKDTPKPRRLTKVAEARDYVGEAIGDLRELLVEEDLLLPDGEKR